MELGVGRVTPFARNPRAPAARTPQEDRQKFDPLPAPELPPVLGGVGVPDTRHVGLDDAVARSRTPRGSGLPVTELPVFESE